MNNEVLSPPADSLSFEKQRITALNSAALFTLAYLVCYFSGQVATLAAAYWAGIPTEIFPGHLVFNIADSEWQRTDIISVYSAGPAVCLALAVAGIVAFFIVRKRRGLKKTFFLWTFLHGINMFLGSLIAGAMTQSGFWFAWRWSGFSDTAVWITAFVFILLLLVTGMLAAPAFLLSCDSISLMQFTNRVKMLITTVIFPWLAGSFVLMLFKIPDLQFYEILQFFTLMLILVPVYILNQNNPYSETVEMPKKTRLAQSAIIFLLLVLVISRVALQNGIQIG